VSENRPDFDKLLQANLARVFSERDAEKRKQAIAEIYAEDAVLYEPSHIATGHGEIGQAVSALLQSLPLEFVFTADGAAVGHHGLARLRWRAGPPSGPLAVTGTDVARLEAGKIKTLHVFLDPPVA
jgi:hypothetical protein